VPAPPAFEELPEKVRHRNWIGPEIKVGGTFLKTQSNRALSNIKYEWFDESEPAEYEEEK
jgi:hypothetical protein